MNMESGKNLQSKAAEQRKERLLTKGIFDMKEKLESLLKRETMFTSFETCEKELDLLKKNGAYVELTTHEGELAAENGLPSKYKDHPLLYGILQTPTFKKIIGDASNNVVVYEDTKEPMIVYHATPADIPLHEGLKPHLKKGSAPSILGTKESLLTTLRNRFKLFPMINLQLYFAQDAQSTKTKAVASTSGENNTHVIYPCFIKISKPYLMNHPDESKYSWDNSDGTMNLENGDFSVKSEKQIMHLPFNFTEIYTS